MILVVGLFLIAIGVFLNSLDEKKFRNGTVISCSDLEIPHNWAYNAKNELECKNCYTVAGRIEKDEQF